MTNEKIVLVPVALRPAGMELLQARPDVKLVPYHPAIPPAEFHALLHGAAAVALSYTRFDRAALAAAPRLQVVARIGVGFDAVDVPALTAAGIPLCVVGTANSRAVAEQAVFFLFALAKKAREMDRRVRTGAGHDRLDVRALPTELHGKTVLVVGFGRIGTRTAPRCAALGMTVQVFDPFVPAETVRAAGFQPVADLDAALPQADYVTLHCPKNADTLGLFGAERLARMKPGAGLVNTARGGIVDEAALYTALASGHLSGAGLDVFDPEPPPATHKLLSLEQVICAPHMAGVTLEASDAMAVATARNMLAVLDGAPIAENLVNPEVLG